MSRKITHLPDTYHFDEDFSIESVPEVLNEIVKEFFPEPNYVLDLTTIQGDYHYNIDIGQLNTLLKQYQEIVNSVTLSESNTGENSINRSIVLYLNNEPGGHDISITVVSFSEEENLKIAGFIEMKIGQQTKDFHENTSARLNDALHFDEYLSANQIIQFIEKISNSFLRGVPFEIDVLTKKDEIFHLKEDDKNTLKNIIRKRDHYLISAFKGHKNGSSILISLHFENHTSGYCYFSVTSDKKEKNDWVRNLIVKQIELDKTKLLAHKKQLIHHPQLQGIFQLDEKLKADQVILSLEKISSQFLGQEEWNLRLLSMDKAYYCYAERQCDELRDQFRKNKKGVLFASKSTEEGFHLFLTLHYRGKYQTNGYYFVALRSPQENATARDFILRLLSKQQERDAEVQLIVKPQFQDSFSFDNQMSAEEILGFLQRLSSRFLTDEIISVRLTTLQGEHVYFYDDTLTGLRPYFQKDIHDLIYISLKENNGRSISIHLQFKSTVAGTNGYYSIIMNHEEENMAVVEFIQNNFRTMPSLQNRKKLLPAIVGSNLPEALEGSFEFNNQLDIKHLLGTLQKLSRRFLPELPMEIKAVTLSGEEKYYDDQEFNRLDYLLYNKNVDYLFVQKGEETGSKLSLYLHFGEDNPQSGYFSIRLDREVDNLSAKKIVLNQLAIAVAPKSFPEKILKGNFNFPEKISADRILAFLNAMVRKSLPKASFVENRRFNFNLRHLDGRTHINLDYNAFRAIYIVEKPSIHIVSVSSNTTTGKFIELAFVFENNPDQENGHYSINCGSASSNTVVRDYILSAFPGNVIPSIGTDQLKDSASAVKPQASPDKKETTSKKAKSKKEPAKPKKEKNKTEKKTNNEFSVEPGLCMLSFGPKLEKESKLKDSVLSTVENLNLKWVMPDGIDGFNVMEKIRKTIHESEFIIADISNQSFSVFFELGIAMMLEKKIIILTSKPVDMPFDFKKYPHIIYRDDEKGLKRLSAELNAYLEK